MKKIYTAALAALVAAGSSFTASAQTENPESLYLVKDNHVVGKYGVNDVDYITFNLPEGVVDSPITLSVNSVGKNTVTYTVATQTPAVAYVHNIVSEYLANVYALTYFGDGIGNLDEDSFNYVLKLCLQSSGYFGAGTQTYTQTDYQDDGTGNEYYTARFSVVPGTKYYLVAWEVDPVTEEPKETINVTTFTTLAPGKSPYDVKVKSLGQKDEYISFDFSGTSEDLLYISTVFGLRSTIEGYAAVYGEDNLFGSWAQNWTLDELLADADWMADGSGEYVMLCRGYDADGNMSSSEPVYVQFEEAAGEGPVVTIFSKSKGDGHVSINFEIAPSNVEEAYVYLDTENNVDDMLNDGWELWEIASRASATDITSDINKFGETTYNAEVEDNVWYSVLIYAKDQDGNRSVTRINFSTLEGSSWDISTQSKAVPAIKKLNIRKKAGSVSNPSIRKKK